METAIVLAAGSGRKVWPYGEFRQKCTIPIANKPIVRRIVEDLLEVGCQQIIVVVGHHAQQVRGAVADIPNIVFVTQQTLDGTASAALTAVEHLEAQPYLVIHGDTVTTSENLRNFVNAFRAADVEAAALVQPLGSEDASNYLCAGVGTTEGNNGSVSILTGIEGHPRGGSHRLCGVYAFQSSVTRYLLRNPGIVTRVPVGGMPPPESEIAQSLQLMVDDGRTVLAVQTSDFFVDVDKPWHVLEANRRLVDYLAKQVREDQVADGAKISDAAEINGHVVLGKNTVIGPRVVVNGTLIAGANNNITNGAILHGNIFVGNQCRISDYCDVGSSAIGNRCIIGHGAEMSGVLFDKVYLYHYCEMSGVFGCATDIGAATVCGTLRFDDKDTPIQVEGRYEVPPSGANATYMGDYCRTGVNAIIMPGRRIGSYSVVGPGVILYDDVPSKTMVMAKQELVTKPWGPERYGW
ncbi:NTP transferase domain-containing protein [Candidatus Poribacteria bacterium]|nr:NTP transferase domain-containing protein [Candidatus Poribacteria bacterium]